jgi:hypothetical protein
VAKGTLEDEARREDWLSERDEWRRQREGGEGGSGRDGAAPDTAGAALGGGGMMSEDMWRWVMGGGALPREGGSWTLGAFPPTGVEGCNLQEQRWLFVAAAVVAPPLAVHRASPPPLDHPTTRRSERERRRWEEEEKARAIEELAAEEARAARREAVLGMSAETQAGRERAMGQRAARDAALAAKRQRLKAAFLQQQVAKAAAKAGSGRGGGKGSGKGSGAAAGQQGKA